MTEKTVSIPASLIRDAENVKELEDWGPCPEATGPQMDTRGIYMWKDENGAESGIWECTAGPSRWVLETHEFLHVLSGSMTITADGGEAEFVGPGDTVFVPRGWSGNWEIHETLRKVFVIF
ncbi:cupin domain-containing protein [Arthrobacter sp. H14-L1]|uniref:cupin domain-containing protein n=1 Tax=Arthrobacter sp. H14-L1 TaxID=2996697 RepID=UPI002270A41D|nr:cupin domain-containing protein [Arthrobacter sp. H14-L1]MCY0906655.1 cupin domain-containing protein [Arthrobacter sp. H14-L1]